MTTAGFIEVCMWPLAIVLAVLLRTVRDKALFRFIGAIALAAGVFYFARYMFFRRESLAGVVNFFIFMGVAGVGFLWFLPTIAPRRHDLKSKLKRYGSMTLGTVLIAVSGWVLFLDFAMPRIVLEGRVENARALPSGFRSPSEWGADIAGRTVKATRPVYERLQLKPYVRVEVGRGSDYIYKIDYLAN